MFQFKISKGYDSYNNEIVNTYCIYDAYELVIMPKVMHQSLLNLPQHYKLIGSNPLTLQNVVPVVIDLNDIIEYINQNENMNNYANCLNIPFGYPIPEEDYLELLEIYHQSFPDVESEKEQEIKRGIEQTKNMIGYLPPQNVQQYSEPQQYHQQQYPQQPLPQQQYPQQQYPQQQYPQQQYPQQPLPQQFPQQRQFPQQLPPQKCLRPY